MIICRNCGVELEENANFCSLCGEPLLDSNGTELDYLIPGEYHQQVLSDYQKLTLKQRRKVFLEIVAMILFSGILISFTINLIGNHAVTWSKYVVTTGIVVFVNIVLISFLRRKLFIMFFLSFLSVASLIFFLDVFSGHNGWITRLGVPLLLGAYVIVLAFILVERRAKQKGLNIIAYSLIASGLLCVCIDGVISIYATDYIIVGWSLTVLVSIFPIAVILLYVHHRLKKVTDLKRFFHI